MIWLNTFLFVILLGLNQPQDSLKLIQTFPAQATNFEVDKLGNIYLIDKSKLIKLNRTGEKLHEYSNPMLGDISSVDVGRPLRLLVFYRESNQLQFLNNALSEITSPIEFDNHEIYSVQLACNSAMNCIWLFDTETRQLIQYDQNMGIVQKSPSIDQIIEGDCLPNMLFEKQNHVYLNCPGYGIIIFDQFGSFSKKFPKPGIKSFCSESGNYYFQVGYEYYKFSGENFEEIKIPLPFSAQTKLIKYINGKFYVLGDEEIKVFGT